MTSGYETSTETRQQKRQQRKPGYQKGEALDRTAVSLMDAPLLHNLSPELKELKIDSPDVFFTIPKVKRATTAQERDEYRAYLTGKALDEWLARGFLTGDASSFKAMTQAYVTLRDKAYPPAVMLDNSAAGLIMRRLLGSVHDKIQESIDRRAGAIDITPKEKI